MKNKPQRMCVACRGMFDKDNLIKAVKNKDNNIRFDEGKNLGGRGAYVCKSNKCREKCIKTRGFNRAFKCNVPNDIYENLK